MGKQRYQLVLNCANPLSEPAFELFCSRSEREIGLCSNEIDDRFRLNQIHFAVKERTLGKLARPRRPRSAPKTTL